MYCNRMFLTVQQLDKMYRIFEICLETFHLKRYVRVRALTHSGFSLMKSVSGIVRQQQRRIRNKGRLLGQRSA